MHNSLITLRNLTILIVGTLLLFTGCEKKSEPTTAQKVISKKIDVSEKKISADKVPDTKKAEAGTKMKPVPKTAVAKKKEGGEKGTDFLADISGKAARPMVKLAYIYDPTDKIDPFETIFRKREQAGAEKERQVQKKRIPLTPLEKIALSQLKLVAVMLAPSGSRALVEEASGKGYIITNGTYIGKNSGRVIDILLDKVVVEEEVEDVLGKLVVRKTEMKLQKTPGE